MNVVRGWEGGKFSIVVEKIVSLSEAGLSSLRLGSLREGLSLRQIRGNDLRSSRYMDLNSQNVRVGKRLRIRNEFLY